MRIYILVLSLMFTNTIFLYSHTIIHSTVNPTKSPAWNADGWEGDAHKPTDNPTKSPSWKADGFIGEPKDGWMSDGWEGDSHKPTDDPTFSPSFSP